MVERVEKKLSELNCDFLSGFAFKSTDYSNQGIPLIKIGNIQNRIVAIDEKGNYIEESLINEKTEKYLLSNRDILIAMTGQGSVGRVGRLILNDGQKAILNQRVGKFICDEVNLNKEYLYYILTTDKFQDSLFHTGAGSGQPNLSPELILQTEIPYCEFDEQKSIASILSSLDDKIDLLHRQNATLEKMAETLFRQWFVEEAREDWKITKIKDFDVIVTDYVANGSFASLAENVIYKSEPDHAILIRLKDFNSDFKGDFVYVNQHAYEFLNKSKLFGGEIIISNVGEYSGTVFKCPKLNRPMTLGPNSIVLISNYNNLFYLFFRSDYGRFLLDGIISGSAQPKFNKTAFRELEISYPSMEYIIEFEQMTKPYFDKIDFNQTQIRTLTTLRDTLLPKLMSGEVRVEM